MKLRLFAALLLIPVAAFPAAKKKAPVQREVKIQKTSLSRDQEVQLGNEAAAEVEKTMEVVNNAQVETWLNSIGQNLAKQPQANAYPFHFKLLNDDSINAFALPGGPMFVHTGLIKAADSESQVAGVLAHEMSHVALRHGASQMSRAQTWQTIMGVVGSAAGMVGGGQCGLLCQAVQMGGGLGVNSVLMRFSRDMERDADLNGARMMASAGYNPLDLAHFFQKLEAQTGSAGAPKGLAAWFASHPNPGDRVQYVTEDTTFYAKKDYTSNTGNFDSVKHAVALVPPAKKKPAALLAPKQGAQARTDLPQNYKDLQAEGFAVAYPADWQAGQPQSGGSVYIVPQNGAKQNQQGGVELISGAMIDYYQPQGGKVDLKASTDEMVQSLKKGDPSVHADAPSESTLGGKPAMIVRMTMKTSDQQDQTVYLYTVAREVGLWNMALASPSANLSQTEPIFRQIARTVAFPD